MTVNGASRTDAGVHAEGQVASFSYNGRLTAWDFKRGLNALLPKDIAVNRVEITHPKFHARHSSRGKIYVYQIWSGVERNPFLYKYVWSQKGPPDVSKMNEAATIFEGTHDFSAFRAADCSSDTPTRTIHSVTVKQCSEHLIQIRVVGSGFLKQMVRILAGTLLEAGRGRQSPEHIRKTLARGERKDAGQTAPAKGLILREVFYPSFPWPSQVNTTYF